jgi:hypothetical protein
MQNELVLLFLLIDAPEIFEELLCTVALNSIDFYTVA